MDVQTELDTIRKSILRRWYAVKIIPVSPARLGGRGGRVVAGRGGTGCVCGMGTGSQTQRQFVLA